MSNLKNSRIAAALARHGSARSWTSNDRVPICGDDDEDQQYEGDYLIRFVSSTPPTPPAASRATAWAPIRCRSRS